MNHCISVKTNKVFFFGGAKIGFIKMTIDSITNLPKERKYNLVITDSCYKEVSKNQRDNTLSFAGKVLVFILDTIDKNHCKKSIKTFDKNQ